MEADLEEALGQFRQWFSEATQGPVGLPPEVPEGLDLATLLGHFVALRQEVNLQTRAVRTQQEQSAETLGRLNQAVELATRAQARLEQVDRAASEEKLRPLLYTLADLYDSMANAAIQIRRATESVLPRLQELFAESEKGEFPADMQETSGETLPARSFWSRWILSPAADASLAESRQRAEQRRLQEQTRVEATRVRARELVTARQQIDNALASLLSGYNLNLERIDRALRKHGLEPIAAVGELFDPEKMEVLDGVLNSGRPAGEVLEEVQRGYTYNGRVLRYARVRVAK